MFKKKVKCRFTWKEMHSIYHFLKSEQPKWDQHLPFLSSCFDSPFLRQVVSEQVQSSTPLRMEWTTESRFCHPSQGSLSSPIINDFPFPQHGLPLCNHHIPYRDTESSNPKSGREAQKTLSRQSKTIIVASITFPKSLFNLG